MSQLLPPLPTGEAIEGRGATPRRDRSRGCIVSVSERRLATILLAIPVVLQMGCATTGDATAKAALGQVEQSLLDASVLRIDYVVEASGAVEAMLHGDLVAQKPALASIVAHGFFAGSDVDLRLVSDGETVAGSNGANRFSEPLPPALISSIRMT